jgi:hypothetical protein
LLVVLLGLLTLVEPRTELLAESLLDELARLTALAASKSLGLDTGLTGLGKSTK